MQTRFYQSLWGCLLLTLMVSVQAETRTYNIPAGPLETALNAFALQSQMTLPINPAWVQGKRANAVSGPLTPRQALQRLLAGSGLTFTFAENNTVILQRAITELNDPIQLETITVTGELQERDLQATQSSVSVVTGEELDRRDDFDIRDVFERTPNVTSANGELSFTVRGIEARGVSANGQGLLVNVQVDGVSLPNEQTLGFGPYSTWDLQQVEILRGPQSTQQGRNALAGAVIFRSADPTYDFEVKGRGDLGSRNTQGGAIAVNVPVIDEKLALRFSAERKESDGFVDAPVLGINDYDFDEITTLRGKLLFEPTDNLRILLGYSHTDNKTGEDRIEYDLFPTRRVNLANESALEGNDIDLGNLHITWNITDNLQLDAETALLGDDYTRIEDLTGGDAFGVLDIQGDTSSISQEIKLSYTHPRFRAVGGGFVTDISNESDTNFTVDAAIINPALAGASITQAATASTDTYNIAAFGEIEIEVPELAEGLSFVVGGRYDYEEVDFTNRAVTTTDSPVPLPLPPEETSASDTSFDAFLPKVGVVYDWSDDLSTGLTLQRGYRAGGTFRNPITGAVSEWEPEYTWNVELSVRSQWFDERLTANANLYYTDWTDQQVLVAGDSGIALDNNATNAGSSRLYGGELEVRARLIPAFDLFGAFGFSDTEFTEFENNGEDLSGNKFTFAPEFTAALGGKYYFDNGMAVGADATYTGASFSEISNDPATEAASRFLLNAAFSYEEETWSITFYARNLLDKAYLLQQDTQDNFARAGEPLTMGVFANFNF